MEHWQKIAVLLMIYDVFAVNFSYFLALLLRHEMSYAAINAEYIETWTKFAPVYTIFCITLFWILRLYRSLWRFASYYELAWITIATGISSAFHLTMVWLF